MMIILGGRGVEGGMGAEGWGRRKGIAFFNNFGTGIYADFRARHRKS